MKERLIKKLYSNKLASLRDYEVKEFIKEGGVILKYKNQKMTLTSEALNKGFQCHSQFIKSKVSTFTNPLTGLNGYCLIDFVWKNDN